MESIEEQQSQPSPEEPKAEEEGLSLPPKAGQPGYLGKHRMAVALSHVHNQINLIQEELDELETLGESSIVCTEFVSSVESVPDPLLPRTKAPADVSWDRWFRGAHNSRNHRRWFYIELA